jgi:hypothetical protein
VSNNTIDLEFADGEYHFALGLERINELQKTCGIGIGGLFNRLWKGCGYQLLPSGELRLIADPAYGEFFAADIIETLRQGLIGGGKGLVNGEEIKVTPEVANRLIKAYVLDRPLIDSWTKAVSVLGACVMGYDPPKKDLPPNEGAPQPGSETTDTSTTT